VVAPAVDGGGIQVALSDARVFEAAVVGADPDTDLAVVQIQAAPDDLTALEFGNSDTVAVGQPVMALGNPLGLSNTVTVGIVSALDRPVTTQNASSTPGEAPTPVVTNAIQTDAAVNPGNSGGALVNDSGQLVGINSSIATLGASDGGQGGSIGLGFAIPSNEAEWVARQLIETGDVDHAYLGVSLESAIVSVDGVARQGAGITDVAEGTAAAEGGLQAGEAITQVDGETVRGADSLIAQIREREPGTRVTLTVVSEGGDTREISVEFGTRDEP
jgi:putative serine protease PepD